MMNDVINNYKNVSETNVYKFSNFICEITV